MTCVLPPNGWIPWFSKTEGNTYATVLHHPFLFKGRPTHVQEVARRILAPLPGRLHQVKSRLDLLASSHLWCRLRTTQDIPSTHHKLLSLALHFLPFASRFPLPHFTLVVLFAFFFRLFSLAFCVLVLCAICCLHA